MSDLQLSDEVRYQLLDGGVALVTLDRPAQRNAINQGMGEGLRQAWRRIDADPQVRVAVLTGAGDQAFCAGMDLKWAAALGLQVPPPDLLPVLGDNESLSKPVIAAVNGLACAGGFLFAQMCDLCIAAEHAQFAITEARVGRGMPWAAPLMRMLPQRVAMELLLTGAPMSAQRALALGFVNDVVPLPQLLPRALQMARQIAANAPLTVAAARELVYLSAEMGRSAGLRAARQLFRPVYLSDDAQEGPRAFAEKRPPRWSGR